MRYLILAMLCLFGVAATAQPPNLSKQGNANTFTKQLGVSGADTALALVHSYADTVAANKGYLKTMAGAIIRIDGALWVRNSAANKWVAASSGTGGGVGISKLGSSTYGLILVNDSTYKVDSSLLSLIFQRRTDSLNVNLLNGGKIDTSHLPSTRVIFPLWAYSDSVLGIRIDSMPLVTYNNAVDTSAFGDMDLVNKKWVTDRLGSGTIDTTNLHARGVSYYRTEGDSAVLVLNDSSKYRVFIGGSITSDSLRKYIPRGGTASDGGGPVTGDVEISNSVGSVNILSNDFGFVRKISFTDDPALRISATESANSALLEISPSAVSLIISDGTAGASMLMGASGLDIASNTPSAGGITSFQYFPNKRPNTFSQMQDIADTALALRTLISSTGGAGTVTSVGLTMPGTLFDAAVSGSPVTTTGTFAPTLKSQSAWHILRNNTSGSAAPTFGKLNVNSIDATGTPGSGNFLRGDGSWTAGALSPWNYTGSDIYYNAGKVGIGTTSPSSGLDISSASLNGLTLSNPTAATAGVGRASNILLLTSKGWNTTGSNSVDVQYRMYSDGLSSAIGQLGTFNLQKQINGAGWYNQMSINESNITFSNLSLFGVNSITVGGGASSFGNSVTISRNTIYGNLDGLILDPGLANAGNPSAPSTRITMYPKYWNGSGGVNAPSIYMRAEIQNTSLSKWVLYSSTLSNIMEAKNTGEVGIGGAAAATAKLDVSSTTQGFLPPRMTTTQISAISSPAEGLTIYDLTLHKLYVYDGSTWQAAW